MAKGETSWEYIRYVEQNKNKLCMHPDCQKDVYAIPKERLRLLSSKLHRIMRGC